MVLQKEIPFSNINDTEYNRLIKDLKVKPKKITKETIFEKQNLSSDNKKSNVNIIQVSNSRKTTLSLQSS